MRKEGGDITHYDSRDVSLRSLLHPFSSRGEGNGRCCSGLRWREQGEDPIHTIAEIDGRFINQILIGRNSLVDFVPSPLLRERQVLGSCEVRSSPGSVSIKAEEPGLAGSFLIKPLNPVRQPDEGKGQDTSLEGALRGDSESRLCSAGSEYQGSHIPRWAGPDYREQAGFSV